MRKQKKHKSILHKCYIGIIFIMSCSVSSGNVIFKNGFEKNLKLIQGSVQGLVSTGLIIKLVLNDSEELLSIENSGVFSFTTWVPIGAQWMVEVIAQPATPLQQNCQIINNSGIITDLGVDNILINCITVESRWDEMSWDTNQWN